MATELLDDELWRLIKPLLPVRNDASAIPVGNGLMTAARLPADCSCCVPGSLGNSCRKNSDTAPG